MPPTESICLSWLKFLEAYHQMAWFIVSGHVGEADGNAVDVPHADILTNPLQVQTKGPRQWKGQMTVPPVGLRNFSGL